MDDETRELLARVAAKLAEDEAPDPLVCDLCAKYEASPELAGLRSRLTEKGRIKHLVRLLGHLRVSELSLTSLDDYRITRKGEKLGNRKQTTRPATRNREVVRLVRILNWSLERKLVRANPIAGAPLEEEENTRRTSIEGDDVDLFRHACDEYLPKEPRIGLTLWAMIATKFDSGMRRAELCSIKRAQLRWRDGEISLHEMDTKGREGRITVLSQRAADAIRAIPRDLRFAESPYVFLTKRGKPYHPRTFLRMFQEVAKLAGVEAAPGERVWAHDLRAGFIGQQLEIHMPERDIMEMTGHKSHDVFDRYVRRKKGVVARARALLDQLHEKRAAAHRAEDQDVGQSRLTLTEKKTTLN